MKNLLRLSDLKQEDVWQIFQIADKIVSGEYQEILKGRTVVMFFPSSSIRTRVTFERGIYLLGGQTILFDPSTLDKKEDIRDVIGYLNQWADVLVIRYPDIAMLDRIKNYATMPVINAMTNVNHPCEMLSDLYALYKMGRNIQRENFLFVGTAGNIGYAWKEAAELMGFSLEQCCPEKYRMDGVTWQESLEKAAVGKDIICTDSIPKESLTDFQNMQVDMRVMQKANQGAILNPCPPFYRGEEVSADVIDSAYFVGYEFKKCLLDVQMAIIIYLLSD